LISFSRKNPASVDRIRLDELSEFILGIVRDREAGDLLEE
jgi:hypothetical protein